MNTPTYSAAINPIRAILPDANHIVVRAITPGNPATYEVLVGQFIPEVPGTPEIPGVPEVPQQSGPNLPDYVPAQPAVPAIPAVPATPARLEVHFAYQFAMTQAEWDNWPAGADDGSYLIALAIAHRPRNDIVLAN